MEKNKNCIGCTAYSFESAAVCSDCEEHDLFILKEGLLCNPSSVFCTNSKCLKCVHYTLDDLYEFCIKCTDFKFFEGKV